MLWFSTSWRCDESPTGPSKGIPENASKRGSAGLSKTDGEIGKKTSGDPAGISVHRLAFCNAKQHPGSRSNVSAETQHALPQMKLWSGRGWVVVVVQTAINSQWQSMKSRAVRWFMIRICHDTPHFTLGELFLIGHRCSPLTGREKKNAWIWCTLSSLPVRMKCWNCSCVSLGGRGEMSREGECKRLLEVLDMRGFTYNSL